MTGFGRGVAEHAGVRATVDIRAVNHRFLDIKLRGNASARIEDAVTTRIRATLERGAIAVTVHVQQDAVATASRIDPDAAQRASDQLCALATQLGLAKPDLALVLAQPNVVIESNAEPASDPTVVVNALDLALAQLDAMRVAEGKALAAELLARLDELVALRATIAGLAANVPQLAQKKLHERLRRLLEAETAVDPQRLAQEVALLADRADVTEELVRLASHVEQARALITGAAAAGRRLDFLVQEIGRELNTIGSKSNVAEISSAVVDGKAVLEKVREQVQNVE